MKEITKQSLTVKQSEVELVEMSNDLKYYEVTLKTGKQFKIRSTVAMFFENGNILFG